jgi:prepilin-type N-terminal cleavage/methylation domain-containing protein
MYKKDFFRILTVGCLRVFVSGDTAGSLNIAPMEEINNRGVTLVELIVVITVIASLAIALGFSYADWMGKYKVEKATKELYVDLMNARCMAMTSSCDHFVDFNFPAPPAGNGTYRLAEDTDGDGEGDDDSDGIIDAAGQTFLPPFAKTVEYTIENNFEDKIINFKKRGIVQPKGQAAGGTICLFTEHDPDYDCIVISQTRINMGKLRKQKSNGGKCNTSNCDTK